MAVEIARPRTAHRLLWCTLLVSLIAVASCAGLDEVPEGARVTVEGPSSTALVLVTSNNFLVIRDSDTGEERLQLTTSDTVAVTPPFDETYLLGEFQRFYVRLANLEAEPVLARMRVLLDSKVAYDREAELVEDTFMEYSYRYYSN